MEQVTTISSSTGAYNKARPGIYESIVRGIFGRITTGHLHVILPSGERFDAGDRTSAHSVTLRIRNERFFRRAVLYADIGFGESYVDGDWDTDNLPALLKLMIMNLHALPLSGSSESFWNVNLLKGWNRLQHHLRDNTVTGSRKNIADHYDLSNDFYRLWLDETMTYSSAMFARSEMTLAEAQAEKYEQLCRTLRVSSDDHVLEIGTGWGGFAEYAAREHGARVTSITISRAQYSYAVERIRRAGLESRVSVLLRDYREVEGEFDKVVSIEMLEAVGHSHLKRFFEVSQRVLKPNGLLGLQVITSPDSRYDEFRKGVDWIQKHIFPGSLLPSIAAINSAVNKTGQMHLYDLKDFGLDYARTLAEWRRRFNSHSSSVRALGFDEPFMRKWNYYLSYCEAAFSTRNISVVQLAYTRPNNGNLM